MIIKNQSLGVILACATTFLFRVILDFVYINYIIRFYSDFPFIEHGVFRLIESYFIILTLCFWIASSLRRKWRPSGIVLVLYFIIVMVPLSSQYGLADAPAILMYATAGNIVLLAIFTELHPKLKFPSPGHGVVHTVMIMLLGISIYVYGSLVLTGGLRRLSWNLLTVYEVRAEYVQQRGPLMGYFTPWQAYVINILGLLYALNQKRYFMVNLFIIAQLLLFGMTGQKSFLLAPFLVGGIYWGWQKRNAFSLFVISAFLIVLASYSYFLITGNHFIPSLFIRRLFFIPSRLHVLYYDFFSQPSHPFYMLSESILIRGVFENLYDMPMKHVIALAYWKKKFWPNVGYLGDAYGNFGLPGMFLFSIILGFILQIIDSIGSHLPPQFVAATIAMPAAALTQSGLFTTMLTHGLILVIIILWITKTIHIHYFANYEQLHKSKKVVS